MLTYTKRSADNYSVVSANTYLGGYTVQCKMGALYCYPLRSQDGSQMPLSWRSAEAAWAWIDRDNVCRHPWWSHIEAKQAAVL